MNENINEIISRVLSGEASSDEIQLLLKWFEENEENSKEFARYEKLWNALEIISKSNNYDSQRAYQKFKDYLDGTLSIEKPVSLLSRLSRIAALVIFTSGLAFLAGYYMNPGSNQSAKLCQITTPKGSKAYVELADGTKVWLNAESSLKYPENFDSEGRNVYLEGEGYFEVAKDKNRPFIVHTSQIDIKALGTVFNVKSYTSEDIIQTTLVEGSVVIEKRNVNRSGNTSASAGESATYMKPNQQVTFYKTTSVIDITSKTSVIKSTDQFVVSKSEKIVKKDSLLIDKKVDIKLFTAWKDNRLVFDNEPFESLSVKLERRFNMKFSFMDDEIRSFRFTGQFNEISMEQLLEALQYASPFHYVINKSEVFIGLKPLQLKNNE